MSDEEATGEEETKQAPTKQKILLIPYPKFIFMYPTLIASLVAWAVLALGGENLEAEGPLQVTMTGIFLAVMAINMFIIVFDFPRATSLTLFFIGSTFALGLWVSVTMWPDFLPTLQGIFAIKPAANATFFGCISVAMVLLYGAVFVSVKFNYWELSNNELLHHHGLLSDLKRYPAPNLRVDKEINDVFEYMLLGAGRLILHPTTEKRAIVLDNILFVGQKERMLTKTLGSIKVKIGQDSGA